ncbi:sigma-54 dependent transcriptional regulator [Oleispirillum naphthae]|uniref:sigma-54-dependent transcriptional regulator n=1 Tax=Oleispirillum naphthae TaxID=2838853 RepID=UPI0030825B1D
MAEKPQPKVLIVEDTPSMAELYAAFLDGCGYAVSIAETGKAALAAIRRDLPDVVLLDIHLPDISGLEILKILREEEIPSACVVITAHGSINVAVEAMQSGARDFLVKPFAKDRLVVTVRNVAQHASLERIVERLKEDYGPGGFYGMLGSSLPMQAIYRTIDSVATSRATVFVTGESGTGKELCAEAIHRASPRRDKPFVAINCGAIPRDLMESEIFGHVKGAFTGAAADREGAARRADGGTLFLDEICEMDLDLQTKLLRFVQSGMVQKVGGDHPEKVDVRFICATNRDPWAEVEAGAFREDLYYRLHVIPVHLPPLRERDADVIEIARALLTRLAREESKSFAGFSPEAEARLLAFPWPGNVRQLQNVLRNVVVLHDGAVVEAAMLPATLMKGSGALPTPAAFAAETLPQGEDGIRPLWEVEREIIEAAVAACGGNVPRAAARLQISASTIYRKKMAWDEGKPA